MQKDGQSLLNSDVPMGLGMALAQNVEAMQAFSAMEPTGDYRPHAHHRIQKGDAGFCQPDRPGGNGVNRFRLRKAIVGWRYPCLKDGTLL